MLVSLSTFSLLLVATAPESRYTQQQFVVSGCSDPVLEDGPYALLRGMNMTGLFGESHGNSVAGATLQAQLCKKHGFSTCFPGAAAVDTVPLDAAVKGYFVKDEPHAADFAKYGAEAAAIRDKRPGALAFVNMLGSDATMYEGEPIPWMEHWWGVKTYKEYTDKFISVLKPDILCFDSYPTFGDCGAGVDVEGSGAFFKNGMNYSRDTRDHFLYNLQYIGNRSTEANLTFWNYFHSGWRVDVCGPSEGKIAWQMFASTLHGSRGLLHFVITPGAGDIPNPKATTFPTAKEGGANADAEAEVDAGDSSPSLRYPLSPSLGHHGRLRDFDHGYPGILTFEGLVAPGSIGRIITRLNSVFAAWGPTLMQMRTPVGGQIYLRYGADGDPSKRLAAFGTGSPITNISRGEFNVAFFVRSVTTATPAAHAGGGNNPFCGMMVQNHDHANFRFATIDWRDADADADGNGNGNGGGASPPGVFEVDQHDGRAKPAVDAAPHVDGFQIVLDAGSARLYLFGHHNTIATQSY